MTKYKSESKPERLKKIEDRKIEILMEIGETNKTYSINISKLQTEYKKLDKEQYHLLVEQIRSNQLKKNQFNK